MVEHEGGTPCGPGTDGATATTLELQHRVQLMYRQNAYNDF